MKLRPQIPPHYFGGYGRLVAADVRKRTMKAGNPPRYLGGYNTRPRRNVFGKPDLISLRCSANTFHDLTI